MFLTLPCSIRRNLWLSPLGPAQDTLSHGTAHSPRTLQGSRQHTERLMKNTFVRQLPPSFKSQIQNLAPGKRHAYEGRGLSILLKRTCVIEHQVDSWHLCRWDNTLWSVESEDNCLDFLSNENNCLTFTVKILPKDGINVQMKCHNM